MKTIAYLFLFLAACTTSTEEIEDWVEFNAPGGRFVEPFNGKVRGGVSIHCRAVFRSLSSDTSWPPSVAIVLATIGDWVDDDDVPIARFGVGFSEDGHLHLAAFRTFGFETDTALSEKYVASSSDIVSFSIAWPDDGTLSYKYGSDGPVRIIDQYPNFEPVNWIAIASGSTGQMHCEDSDI